MPRRRVAEAQDAFDGGVNLTADESELAENEVRRADNARLTEFGGVTKILGQQRTSTSALAAAAVRGGHAWSAVAGVQELAVCNGQLFTGTYGIPMTWTARVGALDAAAYPSFATFREGSGAEVVYVADGGQLNKWDGTAVTVNIANTPAAVARVAVQNRRLFGISGTDEVLYWSALDDGDTLGPSAGGGSDRVTTFGGQRLTALLPLGDSLILFHRAAVSRFTGWSIDDITIATGTRGVSADVGTVAPDAIVAVENVGYFLSDRGVFAITEAGVQPISSKIDSVIRALDQTQFARARAVHHKARSEVLFSLPDAGVYAFNYRLQAWSGPWTGAFTSPVLHSMWATYDATGRPIVLFGAADGHVRRADAPAVYKADVLADGTGGAAFTMAVRCRRFFFGSPEREKSLRYLYTTANLRGSTTGSLQWVTDTVSSTAAIAATGAAAWGTGAWGSGSWQGYGSAEQRTHAHGRGKHIDVTISDDGQAESIYSRVVAEAFDMGARY